jgi:hypothetical protein
MDVRQVVVVPIVYSYDSINTFANQTQCVSNFQCGRVFKFPQGICLYIYIS